MHSSLIASLLLPVFANPGLPLGDGKGNAVATLWTFPNETWIENLAVRSNGKLLCTSLSRAAIYEVDPFGHLADLVHQFLPTEGVLGISETDADVFVAVTANISLETNTAWPGSAKMWKVEFGRAKAVSTM